MGEIQGKFTVFRPLWRNSYSFPVCFSCSTLLWNGTEQEGLYPSSRAFLILRWTVVGAKPVSAASWVPFIKKSKPPHRSAPEAYSELFWA